MKYVLALFCFFLTVFSQLWCSRHGNECRCFLRGGILVFLLQRMRGREGERRDMLSFHLCLWRLAFVSTFGQMKEKMEFKAKHLRAFKTVLLICTWLICNNTCGAGWALILPEMERSTFRLFFSDLSIDDNSPWYPPIYFHKENSVQRPFQTVKYGNNCYWDVKCIPTVSGYSFQIWLNNLPF